MVLEDVRGRDADAASGRAVKPAQALAVLVRTPADTLFRRGLRRQAAERSDYRRR